MTFKDTQGYYNFVAVRQAYEHYFPLST